MKILNLYAGIGGNRYKWSGEITAVESDPFLCALYKKRFPGDVVICGDAHEYLLNHFKEFDFIWSSPPCVSHSITRKNNTKLKPVFPDLTLYQEIIFLKHYFKGWFCVENVIPYYQPLIPGFKRGRHLFWCNFTLPEILSTRKHKDLQNMKIRDWNEFHEFDFTQYQGQQRRDKIARNTVDYVAGETILNSFKHGS